jgi:hypothetical protein
MNMTTPVNQKFRRLIESEEMKNMNTNLNTQQSFSSFLTNWNCATSNGSSFQINEDKKPKITNNFENVINQKMLTSNNNNINMGNNNYVLSNTLNNNNIMGNTITTDSNVSNSNLHAKSVDFTNKSPFKIGIKSNNGLPNYPSLNQFPNQADYEQNIMNTSNQNNMFNYPSGNNMAPYSFCHDNNLYYKGYFENFSGINNINKNNICPIKFNPNDDRNILDNILVLTKDQNGCRLIQKKLEEKREEFLTKFYEKVTLMYII